METCKFLQRQHALLKTQPSFLKLNVIAAVGDFFHHQAIGRDVKNRNNTEMINISYQLHNLALQVQLLRCEFNFFSDLFQNVGECRYNDFVDLHLFGEVTTEFELIR